MNDPVPEYDPSKTNDVEFLLALAEALTTHLYTPESALTRAFAAGMRRGSAIAHEAITQVTREVTKGKTT
jgi:hypothetical protein